MTNKNNMIEAIKKLKEEMKARDAEELEKKTQQDKIIIEEVKKEIMEKNKLNESEFKEFVLNNEDLERKK